MVDRSSNNRLRQILRQPRPTQQVLPRINDRIITKRHPRLMLPTLTSTGHRHVRILDRPKDPRLLRLHGRRAPAHAITRHPTSTPERGSSRHRRPHRNDVTEQIHRTTPTPSCRTSPRRAPSPTPTRSAPALTPAGAVTRHEPAHDHGPSTRARLGTPTPTLACSVKGGPVSSGRSSTRRTGRQCRGPIRGCACRWGRCPGASCALVYLLAHSSPHLPHAARHRWSTRRTSSRPWTR